MRNSLLLNLLLLLSCRRELPLPPAEDGLSLFPLYTGMVRLYEVRETTYTTSGPVATFYFLRMRVDTPTRDAYGRLSYYVLWDTASEPQGPWHFWKAGLAYRDTGQVELWDNNQRLWLLRFPISARTRWNRHAYTNLPPQICRYAHTDTLWQGRFPRSVWVLRQVDTTSVLHKAFFYEVYARNTGLVHLYERLDVYELGAGGALLPHTDSYFREMRLLTP